MRPTVVTVLLASLLALHVLPAAAAPHIDAAYTLRVLELTNAERQKEGLAALSLSAELNEAAEKYSQVLASSTCFEHTCGPVPNFADRAAQSGYIGWNSLGENIAAGYGTPDDVVSGWMKSPGHRANILSPKYTEMGVGRVAGGGKFGTYWAQEFGSRSNPTMSFQPLPLETAMPADDAPADDQG